MAVLCCALSIKLSCWQVLRLAGLVQAKTASQSWWPRARFWWARYNGGKPANLLTYHHHWLQCLSRPPLTNSGCKSSLYNAACLNPVEETEQKMPAILEFWNKQIRIKRWTIYQIMLETVETMKIWIFHLVKFNILSIFWILKKVQVYKSKKNSLHWI